MDCEIIGDEVPAIGPADKHWPLELGNVDHCLNLIRPGLGFLVLLRLERLVGIAVAAQVVGYHAEFLGEIALDLPLP
jgi:hypothetical protein